MKDLKIDISKNTNISIDKLKQMILVTEYIYVSFICILILRQYKPDIGMEIYLPLFVVLIIAMAYCFVMYIFSDNFEKPGMIEMSFRLIYLFIVGWLLAISDNISVQIILVLPTILIALKYRLRYTIFIAIITSFIFLFVANFYRYYEYDYQFIFLVFIWMIGLLISSSMQYERQIRREKNELYEKNKLATIGEMVAGIAHEIRNPLTTIKGFVQLLENDKISEVSSKRKEYLSIIDNEIVRLNDLLNDLLQYTKPTQPHLIRNDIEKIINDSKIILDPHFINHKIEFSTNIAKDMPEIYCDYNQIKQVIINIVFNAIDAMEKSTRKCLKVETIYDLKYIYIKIKDTGVGMSREIAEKVYDPFFTTRNCGTGLGLSICYSIVHSHSGKINIKSELGKGTEFIICLPKV
ncbi:MAG: ATP-binding protein [Clostridia bacterium]|nr:ATP-binding protein [Clostridia bacterium]